MVVISLYVHIVAQLLFFKLSAWRCESGGLERSVPRMLSQVFAVGVSLLAYRDQHSRINKIKLNLGK